MRRVGVGAERPGKRNSADAKLKAEVKGLKAENDRLKAEVKGLKAENDRLKAENEK